MSDKREEVLNRLRRAKKDLQESLDREDTGIKKTENIELVEGQKDIERVDREIKIESSEASKAPKKKLFKASEAKEVREVPSELKSNDGLSTKRLAAIQRNIRKKVMSRQSMTSKQKAFALIALVLASMPLFLLNSISLVSCRFDFDNFGLYYRGTPGSVMLTIPVTNPSFVPAHLGELELDLYDAKMSANVASVSTNDFKTIEPFATVVIDIVLRLDPENAGKWISNMFSSVNVDQATGKVSGVALEIYIRNFKYNGLTVAKEVVLPRIDLSDMVGDLTSGLSLSSASANSPIAAQNGKWDDTEDNVIRPWKTAMENPSTAQSMEMLNLNVVDSEDTFELTLDIGLETPAIDNFYLGPIKIFNLNVSLFGNHQNLGSGKREDYKAEVARLETLLPSEVSPTNYKGVERDVNAPISVTFGGMSYVAIKLTLFKDDIGGADLHPSALIDLNNKSKMMEFVQANGSKYPMWNFFNNILALAKIDALIELNNIDLQIFGVNITNLVIPKELLPVIQMEELFDFNDFVGQAPIGIMGAVGMYTNLVTKGYLGLYDLPIASTPKAAQFDADGLGDMIRIDDFDMDMIKESWGPDANLSVGLGIEINNNLLDIYVGLFNVSLGLSNKIDTTEATFALAELINANTGGRDIYIAGLNSTTKITVALTLMKNDVYAPFVGKFIRDLLETFELNGRANLKIDNLILFKQNYTFAGLAIGLGLDGLLNLQGMIEDLLKDSINGLFGPPIEENNTLSEPEFKINPLLYPLQLVLQMALANPLMQSITGGASLPGVVSVLDEEGQNIDVPQAAQDIQNIELINEQLGTKIVVDVANIEIGEGSLPIFLALGYTDLRIQSKNQYGGWSDLLGLLQENYIEIVDTRPFNVRAEVMVYHGETLCTFLNNVLYGKNFDLGISGSLSLNISGVWIPDIKLKLQVEELNLGFDARTMLNGLIGGLLDAQPDAIMVTSQIQNNEQIKMWDGRFSTMPFASQDGVNIDNFLKMGDIVITKIEETGWPYVDQGNITIGIEIAMTSFLMDLEIHDLSATLSDTNGVVLAEIILNNRDIVYLVPGISRLLQVEIVLIKSQNLQDYLTETLSTLEIKGVASLNLSVRIFGCLIDGLNIELDLASLGLDAGSLLDQLIPISPKAFRNGPEASQDVMDLLGDFGLVYVTTGGEISPVGSDNRDDPMFEAIVGLVLQPKFNMSIVNADLKLLDKTIYEAIYANNPANQEDAIEYSKIAQVLIDPVYCNNTYAPEAVQYLGQYGRPALPAGMNYWDVIDPDKPYYNGLTQNRSGAIGMRYYQEYTINQEALYKSFSLGTFAMTEMRLQLFNQSHGSYRNAYPKQYWRNLGGPYFPVQVYGRAQGGYPDHRLVYHPHYSPIANLLSGIMTAMEDPAELLAGLTIAGQISLNLFSMNLTIDTQSPAISGLISSLLEETSVLMKSGLYDAINPFSKEQDPLIKKLSVRNKLDEYYSGEPLPSEIVMDLNIDMESIIDDYPLISVEERNDHIYAPYLTPANDLKYMGNNINPENAKGQIRDDYRPGLYPFGDVIENFHKDFYYEGYKLVVENWRKSQNLDINPFFETSYKNGTIIDDHTKWALRWSGDKGRTPTWCGMIIDGITPAFELGILSAYANLWYDDPITGCSLVPMGYGWLNSSIYPRVATPEMPDPGYENGGMVDDFGNTAKDSNWAILNLRLFDSLQTNSFFVTLLSNVEDINLSFVLDATINASMFGYETYNIAVGSISIDDRSPFAQKCAGQFHYTEEGNIWGIPGSDGSIVPVVPKADWPPIDMLPDYQSETNILNIDGLLDNLGIGFSGISSIGGVIGIGLDLSVDFPLPLPAWLNRIIGRVYIDPTEAADWQTVPDYAWQDQIEVDTGLLNLCLNRFEGEYGNPYDFRINTISQDSVKTPEPITIPAIQIEVEWSTLGIVLDSINLGAVLFSGTIEFTVDTLWLRVGDRTQFYNRTSQQIEYRWDGLRIEAMIPVALQYYTYVPIQQSTLVFDLVDMLDGTEVWDGLF